MASDTKNGAIEQGRDIARSLRGIFQVRQQVSFEQTSQLGMLLADALGYTSMSTGAPFVTAFANELMAGAAVPALTPPAAEPQSSGSSSS